jgi:hypothetical protein
MDGVVDAANRRSKIPWGEQESMLLWCGIYIACLRYSLECTVHADN